MRKINSLIKRYVIKPRDEHKFDIETFLSKSFRKIKKYIKKQLKTYKNIKFQISVQANLRKFNSNDNSYSTTKPYLTASLKTHYKSIN